MEAFDRLIEGIRRRSLWQMLGLYGAGAWVALQVVDVLSDAFDLPGRFAAIALAILIVGLPVVLATALLQQRIHRTGDGADEAAAESSGVGTGSSGARRLLIWRNVIGGGVAAFALWGVVVTAWLVTQDGSGPPGPDATESDLISRSVIAVLPFSVRGSSDLQYLGEGVVSLLGTKLDGAGELRSVDSRALLSRIAHDAESAADPARAAAIARRFGAGLFVMGDVVEADGRLRVAAALYATDEWTEPVAEAAAEGDDAFALVDEIATQLLAGVEGGPGARVRRIAAVTTTSLPAFRAYLAGEAEFRHGSFEPAFEAFRRAVELDTLYAMAYYRLSVAAEWLTRAEPAQEAAEKAYRYSSRLSERDTRLLEAFLAWRRGAHGEAERRYRAIVGTYPTDVEAWFQLGEIQYHGNPLHGRSSAESREAFERVLSFEPNDATSIIHLVRIAAAEGRHADMDSLAARFFALNPDADREHEVRSVQVLAHADPIRTDSFLSTIASESDLILSQVVWNTALVANNPEGVEMAARLLTDETRFTGEVWTMGHTIAAYTLVARGRVRDAFREIETIGRYDPLSAAEFRALLSVVPLIPADREQLRRRRTEVESLDPASATSSGNASFFFSVLENRHEIIQLYLSGVLAARLGDGAAATVYADRLEAATPPAESGTLTTDLAAGVRAQIALAAGRPEDALAAIETVRQDIFYQLSMSSPYDGLILERYTRGEVLHSLGRYEEALPWLEHLGEVNAMELAYKPAATFRRAEIYEALGRPEEAAGQYARFAEMWRDADPDLQPLVAQARAAVRRLAPDGAEP
jgi:tetratricopeptide (TPR) repeat protein